MRATVTLASDHVVSCNTSATVTQLVSAHGVVAGQRADQRGV